VSLIPHESPVIRQHPDGSPSRWRETNGITWARTGSEAAIGRRCSQGAECNYPHCACVSAVSAINASNATKMKRTDKIADRVLAVGIGAALALLVVFELGGWPW
jgi:hypothetical protein